MRILDAPLPSRWQRIVGKCATCSACAATVEFEEGDTFTGVWRDATEVAVLADCPACGGHTSICLSLTEHPVTADASR